MAEDRFRRWLIERIKDTRFSVRSGETLDELAQRLGVQAEVLRVAQAEKAAELARIGRRQAGVSKRKVPSPQFEIWCPEVIFEEIRDRTSRMGSTATELLRAITHTLLSGPDNPYVLLRGWMYRGARYYMSPPPGKVWPWKIPVAISHGADAALRRRADRLGTTKTALVRGALVDFLEGRLPGLHYVAVSEMWQDPNRYWTGNLIRKGRYDGHPGVDEARNTRKPPRSR